VRKYRGVKAVCRVCGHVFVPPLVCSGCADRAVTLWMSTVGYGERPVRVSREFVPWLVSSMEFDVSQEYAYWVQRIKRGRESCESALQNVRMTEQQRDALHAHIDLCYRLRSELARKIERYVARRQREGFPA